MKLLRITTVPISLRILLKGQLEFMVANGIEVLTVSSSGPDVSSLRVPHKEVLMTRSITPIRDFVALIRLVIIIWRFQPDIVHTHTPKAGLLGMLAAWLCRVPKRLHTVAGLPWLESQGLRRWLLKQMEALTFLSSTQVLVNSAGLKKILNAELPRIHKELLVLGNGSTNGIDVTYFSLTEQIQNQARQLRSELVISQSDFVFCFIGRLVVHKGIIELLTAFDHLRQVNSNVKLFLVGPIEEGRESLPSGYLERIKAGNGIVAPGLVEDVRPWLAAADAFVLPTYREGFPNVLLQAGCMGLPVIATNINGCNEIIENESTGLLIEPKNTQMLLSAMTRLFRSNNERAIFGLKLKESVLNNYSTETIWNELLALYKKPITRGKSIFNN